MSEIIATLIGIVFVFMVGFTVGTDVQFTKDCKARGGVSVDHRCFKPDSELK